MGIKCKKCATDNGITQYYGKQCKRCGEVLIGNIKLPQSSDNTEVKK